MAEGFGFCPYCGTVRTTLDRTTCGNCGMAMPPAPASAQASAGLPTAGPAYGAGSYAPVPQSSAISAAAPVARRPILTSWPDFQAMLTIALVPFLAWLGMSVLVGLTFGHAVNGSLGREFSAQSLGDFDLTQWAGSVAMFSALVAGLGFQVVGGSGTSSSSLGLVIAPLGSLTVLAFLTRFATRRAFRRRPPCGMVDLFVRITVVAAIGSALIFLVSAVAILVAANSGTPPAVPPTGLLGGSLPRTPTTASPIADYLFLILFPTLWIGAAAGVFSLPPARSFARARFERFTGGRVDALWSWLSPTFVAIRVYIIVVLAWSIVLVIGAAAWLSAASPTFTSNRPDAGAVLCSIPTLLAVGPNAVFALAFAATGNFIDFGNGAASIGHGGLWQSDGWAILAGILSLVVPPFVAGLWLRIKRRESNPAQVIAAGLGVGLVGLFGAVLSAPMVRHAPSSIDLSPLNSGNLSGLDITSLLTGGGSATTTHLVSDLTQAVLVGGVVVVGAVLLGFLVGTLFSPPVPEGQGVWAPVQPVPPAPPAM